MRFDVVRSAPARAQAFFRTRVMASKKAMAIFAAGMFAALALAGAITYKLGSTVTEKVFASDKPVLMQLRLGSKKGPFLLTGAGAGAAAGVAATRPSDEKPKPKSVSQ